MKKIFLLFFSLLSITSQAQYTEYFQFYDMRGAVIYNAAFKKIINNDAEILERNRVREVRKIDAEGKPVFKMGVNNEGWAEYYSTYGNDGESAANYTITWEDGRITKAVYTEGERKITYDFYYNDGTISLINANFGYGVFEDYIFEFKETNENFLLDKLMYKDKAKDSVYLNLAFNYNDEGKLWYVRETGWGSTLETIDYGVNSVSIREAHYTSHTYTFESLRIVSEETTYPRKQLRAKVYPETGLKDLVKRTEYYYKENGLIDYVETNSYGSTNKIKYEYSYYD